MKIELTSAVRKKLHRPTFWHLVTLDPDGGPHVRPVWAEEGYRWLSTNLATRPCVGPPDKA